MPPPINPPKRPPDHAPSATASATLEPLSPIVLQWEQDGAERAHDDRAANGAFLEPRAARRLAAADFDTADRGCCDRHLAAIHRQLHRGRRDGGDTSGDGVSGIGPQPNTLIDGNGEARLR